MKTLSIFLLFIFGVNLSAQINLVQITPNDGSINVSLNTTITVEFDQPLDTLRGFNFFQDFFTNAFNLQAKWYSPDLKTVSLGANLDSNKNYYFLVYSAYSESGEPLVNPSVVYFTTSGVLTGHTVTGTVSAGVNSGVDLSNTLVALSSTSMDDGEPTIEAGTFANRDGLFSIPNVINGEYFPLAANDANYDGELDPSGEDAFSFLDIINVNGDYTGLDFVLSVTDPITLLKAFQKADSLRHELLPGNALLKRITTWNTDSLGNAGEWEFYFVTDTANKVNRLRIDQFGYNFENRYDEWEYQNLLNMDILPSMQNSVDLSIFMSNAEAAGGYEFRTQDKPNNLEFSLELILADHRYSYLSYLNPDTSKHVMWAACYRWNEKVSEDDWETESEMVYFGDYETGSLIITDIKGDDNVIPTNYRLDQNYPNPFNPSTQINYAIPAFEGTSKNRQANVQIIVYDLLGNEMATLVNEKRKPGNYSVLLDASAYPSGTYFYQLKTDAFSITKKMMLLK